jgi:hypothetical protein
MISTSTSDFSLKKWPKFAKVPRKKKFLKTEISEKFE